MALETLTLTCLASHPVDQKEVIGLEIDPTLFSWSRLREQARSNGQRDYYILDFEVEVTIAAKVKVEIRRGTTLLANDQMNL